MLSKGIFTKALSSVSHYIYIYIQILQKIELIKRLENLFSMKALQELKTFNLKGIVGSSLCSICIQEETQNALKFSFPLQQDGKRHIVCSQTYNEGISVSIKEGLFLQKRY